MIKHIEIENFRAIGKRISADIAPVTVVLGRNNAGKSTILKFLAMLSQSVQGTPDWFCVTNGMHVDLGPPLELRYKGNTAAGGGRLRFSVLGEAHVDQRRFRLAKRTDGGEGLILSSRSKQELNEAASPLVKYEIKADVSYRLRVKGGMHSVSLFDVDKEERFVGRLKSRNVSRTTFLSFSTEDAQDSNEYFERVIQRERLGSVRREFAALHYLGPIRIEAARVVSLAAPPRNSVGSDGGYTAAHLDRLTKANDEEARNRFAFVRREIERVSEVSKLTVKRSFSGKFPEVVGTNRHSGTEHGIADFGTGVGQFLPVVVQGAIANRGEQVLIEQPEAQLHPTAQLEVGETLARLWLERGVGSIVETHSANMVLRLQHMVVKGELLAKEVAILLVQPGPKGMGVEVTQMRISPKGELSPAIPKEFFGANVTEIIELKQAVMDQMHGEGDKIEIKGVTVE